MINRVCRKISFVLILLMMITPNVNVASAANQPAALDSEASLVSELSKQSLEKAEQSRQEWLQEREQTDPTLEKMKERSGQSSDSDDSTTDYKPNDKVLVIVEMETPSVSDQLSVRRLDFKEANVAQVQNYQSEIQASQQQVLDSIDRMNVWLVKGYHFKNMLNAFSGEVLYKDIIKIKKIAGVKEVHIAKVYEQNEVESEPASIYSAPNIGAEQTWDTGLLGEDITIAIIDTGVNYHHPAFGGNGTETLELGGKQDLSPVTGNGQGYNERVIGGYNWADGNNDIVDRTYIQHGVHVAGIAAGFDATGAISGTPFKGLAPKAKILAEKVVSNNGSRRFTHSVEYIAAIEHAVANGADVINMSFGTSAEAFVSDDPAIQAVENAVKSGVVVAISAGNAAYSTEYVYNPLASMRDYATVGSPSISPSAISVAASANQFGYYDSFDLNVPIESETEEVSDLQQIPMLAYELLPSPSSLLGELEIVDAGLGLVTDFAAIDVSGKIALIERGEISFAAKTANAADNGAVAVIIYNDYREGYVEMGEFTSEEGIPAVFIRGDHGRTLTEALDANIPLTVSFSEQLALADLEYEWMTDFSSWGPEPHLNFKPNFTAPGEDVYSSVVNDDYKEMSGTSMAAPVVTGASALVIESLRSRSIAYTPQDVTTVLSNTAKILINPESGTPYSVRQQGAGRIQVNQAVASHVWVTGLNGEPGIALKAFDQQSITFTLQVNNLGNEERTFQLAGDAYKDATFTDTDDGLEYNDLTLEEIAGAEVSFAQETLTVPAQTTSLIDVTLQLPDDLEVNQFVDGWVHLTPTDGLDDTKIVVPYFGFFGDWNQPQVIDKHWSEYESYFWQTGLFEDTSRNYPLGMSMDYDYWEDYASFSPNGDGDLDVIVPKVSLLRSAERLEVNLLNSQYQQLQTLMVQNNLSKASASASTIRRLKGWNGTLNQEVVEDGQYYIQVIAKAYGVGDGVTQEYVYPVKVDTEQPRLSGQLIEEDGLTNLQISGEDDTGIFYCYIDIYDRNGVYVLADGVVGGGPDEAFMVSVPLEALPEDPYVILTAYDYAGNATQVEVGTELPLFYQGYTIEQNTAIVDFFWQLSSLVTDITVQVDGQEERSIATESNWRNFFSLPLTYGDHTVAIKAFDDEGELVAAIDETIEGLNAISLSIDETITTHHHLTEPVEISYFVTDDRIQIVTLAVEDGDQILQQQIDEPGTYTFYYDAPDGETVLSLQAWSEEDDLLGQRNITIRNVKLFDVQFDQEAYVVEDEVQLPITMRFSEEVDNAVFDIFNPEGQRVTDSVYHSVTDAVYAYQLETASLGSGQFTLQLDAYDADSQFLDRSNAELFLYPTGVLDYGDSKSMIRTNEDSLTLNWDYDSSVTISEDVSAVTIMVNGEGSPLAVNDTSYTLDLTAYEDEETITVQIRATDQEGKEGILTYTIVRDLSAPAWIVFSPYSFQVINEQYNRAGVVFDALNLSNDLDTDSVSLRVAGMEEPELVQVIDEGGLLMVNEVVSFTEEGFQNIELHYQDVAGNTGYYHRKVLVDLTSPTIELTNLNLTLSETEDSVQGRRMYEDQITTTASSLSLQGTVSDQLTSFKFGINDSQLLGILGYNIEAGVADARPFHETYELSEGENQIVLHAEDRAGNQTFIHLTVMKETETGSGNPPNIPSIPAGHSANQQEEGAFTTIIDKDHPEKVEIKGSRAFVEQYSEDESESEVIIDLSEWNTEPFHQLLFTLEPELALLLEASGKDLLWKNTQFEITIPNGVLSDFMDEDGFQLNVMINETQAGVTLLTGDHISIVSPVLTIGEEGRMLSDEIGIALTFNSKLVADSSKVGMYRLGEEGWRYEGISSNRDGNKLFIKTSQLGTFAVLEYDITFKDLNSHWAKNEIEALASMHIVKGMSDDRFSPDVPITRAEFTALLVRALQLPVADYQGHYKDVPADAWYAATVEAASQVGIVAGSGSGIFRPDDEITREQMVVMIVRALHPALHPAMNSLPFEDHNEISDWALASVDWASQEGLVQGMTETQFAPLHSSSRAQAAVMIYRMLQF